MISYNFNRIFKARGIERPFSYLKAAGFSDNFSTKLKNNKVARLDLREIEKLCLLLRCTPDDLFEWIPDADLEVDKDHPINKIKKSDKLVNLTKMLNSVPLGQLEDIEQMIKEKINRTSV